MDNWQKSVRSRALPEDAMTGWNEGMIRLQQLAERLNRLDEQRGRYMTVSELKTEVFGIMQALTGTYRQKSSYAVMMKSATRMAVNSSKNRLKWH